MKVLADLTIIPLGAGLSLSGYVATCEKILAGAGLTTRLHANGTNVEGEWGAVFDALRRCHEALHADGVPRVFTSVSVGTRTDRDQSLDDKVRSVERKLGQA
jgi:uncharacterized protein (TIGR00106 family)